MEKAIICGVIGAVLLSGCSETLPSGVSRYDALLQEGTLVSDRVACVGAACSAQLRALEGGNRANAVVRMPDGCHHVGTEIVADPGGRVYYPRPGWVRPYLVELERDDLAALGTGGKLVLSFEGCNQGEGEDKALTGEISFPAEQVLDIDSRLTDRKPSGVALPLRL
ncbi:MAG: hypothetical protein AAF503_12370 [Pseudomonadota bacterium]